MDKARMKVLEDFLAEHYSPLEGDLAPITPHDVTLLIEDVMDYCVACYGNVVTFDDLVVDARRLPKRGYTKEGA